MQPSASPHVNPPLVVFSDFDGTSLANQGANFGAIGNENVSSTGKGRAYGGELFIQQKRTFLPSNVYPKSANKSGTSIY